jgi:hypothetical protein
MIDIPTKKVWLVFGSHTEKKIDVIERYDSEVDAQTALRAHESLHPGITLSIRGHNVAIPDRTLPTPTQIQGICRVLHLALCAIRNFGHAEETLAMREIAEALHEVPVEMFDERNWDWNKLILRIRDLEGRFPQFASYCIASQLERVKINKEA